MFSIVTGEPERVAAPTECLTFACARRFEDIGRRLFAQKQNRELGEMLHSAELVMRVQACRAEGCGADKI